MRERLEGRRDLVGVATLVVFLGSEIGRLAQWVVLGTGCTGTSAARYVCSAVCRYGDWVAWSDLLVLGPVVYVGLLRLAGRPRLSLPLLALGFLYLAVVRFALFAVLPHVDVRGWVDCLT